MFIPLTTKPRAELRPQESKISRSDWEVLSDFWYPVAVAAQLQDEPMPVQLLDVDLVLYRGPSGTVGVVVDLCPHRNIRLSTGSILEGELVCPFHGLRFGPTGRCRLPALGRAEKLPASYSVRAFPGVERYGLIWTCLGRPEAHTIPRVPALEGVPAEGLDILGPQSWPVSAARQMENFLDVGHVPLVHASTIGGDVASALRPGTIEAIDDALILTVPYTEQWPGGAPRPCLFVYRTIIPFTIDFKIEDHTTGDSMYALNIPSPTSAHRSRVFQVFRVVDATSMPKRQLQHTFMTVFAQVNQQDIDILSSLRMPDLPLDQHHEVHLPPDNICGAYRARLRGLGLGQTRSDVGTSRPTRTAGGRRKSKRRAPATGIARD